MINHSEEALHSHLRFDNIHTIVAVSTENLVTEMSQTTAFIKQEEAAEIIIIDSSDDDDDEERNSSTSATEGNDSATEENDSVITVGRSSSEDDDDDATAGGSSPSSEDDDNCEMKGPKEMDGLCPTLTWEGKRFTIKDKRQNAEGTII